MPNPISPISSQDDFVSNSQVHILKSGNQNLLQKMLPFVAFLLIAFIVGAGYYIWKQGKIPQLPQVSQKQTEQNLVPSPTATAFFPIPLDDKSIENVKIYYIFDGRIEKIEPNSSDTSKIILTLISGRGYRLPQTLVIDQDKRVTPLDEKGEFLDAVEAKTLKENDFVTIDFFYDLSTKEITIGFIRLKSKPN